MPNKCGDLAIMGLDNLLEVAWESLHKRPRIFVGASVLGSLLAIVGVCEIAHR